MTHVVAIIANTGAVNWNVTKSDNGSIFTATNWSRMVVDMEKLHITAANQLLPSGSLTSLSGAITDERRQNQALAASLEHHTAFKKPTVASLLASKMNCTPNSPDTKSNRLNRRSEYQVVGGSDCVDLYEVACVQVKGIGCHSQSYSEEHSLI